MDIRDQVAFVLQVIMALGPIAVYFLGLGLLNSQARPFLISARRDFALLATAFIPVVVVPAVGLARNGHILPAAGICLGVLVLFAVMLPARHSAWVIYNVGPAQFRRVLDRACRRQGWRLQTEGDSFVVQPADIRLTRHGIAWLRNITIELPESVRRAPDTARLLAALREELARESMLPSPAGASLVVIGATLLGLPMWYLFHNLDQIVILVREIFFA